MHPSSIAAAFPAHGVGNRQDLPLPFAFLLIGAAVVLLISFVALAVFWRRPRLHAERGGHLPGVAARALDSRVVRGIAASLTMVLAVCTVAALAFGSDGALNPAPYVIFVWLWIGIVALSFLLGPVWSVINPVRWVHLVLCRVARIDPDAGVLRYRLGYWPAAAGLFAFTWLELVEPDSTSRAVLGVAVAAFITIDALGALTFGRQWFLQADPFEVLSRLYGSLSPVGRGEGRSWVLRPPLAGIDRIPVRAGLLATVSVMLGGTAYDGFSANPAWFAFAQASPSPVLTQTAGLAGMCLLVGTSVWLVSQLSAVWGGTRRGGVATAFAPSLVPIAAGYVVAHYWSLGVYAGQHTLTLLSDPLGTGADWLGTRDLVPSATLIAPTLVACIQAGSIVIGHLLGIIHAHERALTLFDRRSALLGQVPMLLLMIGYTCGGLLLLFSG